MPRRISGSAISGGLGEVVPFHLIQFAPVDPGLTPGIIDARLAAGWFPFGQRWMTCLAWPTHDGTPQDTVWIRVRLAGGRIPDRQRRLLRTGATWVVHDRPLFDAEHQALYEQFRAAKHPDWETTEVAELLTTDGTTALFERTRELAVHDADGRLVAFRWFLQGKIATAGITSVYAPEREGLGTIARDLADQWAFSQGLIFTYPGYVLPGAEDPWYYKLKRGRTEWLDAGQNRWNDWAALEPHADGLMLAEMRRRLAAFGEVQAYPGWAIPCFDPTSEGLWTPYYAVTTLENGDGIIIVWDLGRRAFMQLRVSPLPPPNPVTTGR